MYEFLYNLDNILLHTLSSLRNCYCTRDTKNMAFHGRKGNEGHLEIYSMFNKK